MVKVSASILAGDFANLEREVKKVQEAGADWIHLDVMDGHFVDNLTFGPVIVEAVNRLTNLPLDVHLMIENPDKYIEQFAKAGADYITIHLEATPNPSNSLQLIKRNRAKAGLSIKPETSFNLAKPYLKDLDLFLVMTVNPGFAGQSFMPDMLPKLKEAREYLDRNGLKQVELEVDGGISPHNASQVKGMGATVLVAATAIFSQPDYRKVISQLKEKTA
ncbi:MAG: ribulose-phosphate 3-epimerase [candidate division Zixibacteria bacterium]|nr:ribulose-phosphate 3-epimerase [candidate division Zixibacteria bacterium]